ncbi:MAG: YedE-related selenium metabolism membrane protein [Armatimonadetes bacterium]|jgi:YedE family putative selenium metabolism protein|nr:YedE-related selenium metabolism membrane protein [Armatimonadota bacterium]
MSFIKCTLTSKYGPIITGIFVGILSSILVYLGNPGNMGICVACFTRDIAGALGLHRAGVVQYIRPEIIGFVLGALVAALAFREFRPRCGSSPIVRFFLGAFALVGALVFLGCPWRAFLRLAGGDWNAIPGIAGLVVGVLIGIGFLKTGFSLGRNKSAAWPIGWIMPTFSVVLLFLLLLAPLTGRDPDGNAIGPVFFSTEGPASMSAPVLMALGVGLFIGFLAQRSRFCTVGAIRDFALMRDGHLLYGVIALIAAAFVTNLALGQFKAGFANQPVAHTHGWMNFAGMLLAGLAFTLAGGCPGRQVFLSGEGDGDAGVFVLGMLVGAGFAHNFSMASSGKGPGPYSLIAVVAGIVFCVIAGLFIKEHKSVGG